MGIYLFLIYPAYVLDTIGKNVFIWIPIGPKKNWNRFFFLWALISPILESLLPIVWFEVLKCYFRYSNTQTQSQKFKICTLFKNVVHTNRVYFCELNKKSIFLANIIEYLAYNFQTKNIYLERILFLSRWNLPKYLCLL